MQFYKFPLAFCLATAMALSSSGVIAANKKHNKDEDKGSSHQVTARASGGQGNSQRHVAAARHSSGSNTQQHIARAGNSGQSRTRHVSSSQLASVSPSKIDRSRGQNNARHVSSSQIASASPRKIDKSSASARRQFSSPNSDARIARSQLAARSTDDSRVLRASRADHIDRRSTAISSSSPSAFSSSIARHDYDRDRSSYRQRHEHHSSDWYRSNGWSYDEDYWRSHHHHRYYNDLLGLFIFDNFGPGYNSYGYGYSPYGYGYDSGYGYGYSEPMVYRENYYGVDYDTRVAVQDALAQAGYYNGPIDGIIGSGTRAAISNYQYDAGLPVTGMIDNSLVQSLGLY